MQSTYKKVGMQDLCIYSLRFGVISWNMTNIENAQKTQTGICVHNHKLSDCGTIN